MDNSKRNYESDLEKLGAAYMKTIIIFLFVVSSAFSTSPFHTDIVITSPIGALTGKGGERRPDGHKGSDCHAKNFYPVIYPVMDGKVIEVDIDDILGKYVTIRTILIEDKILSTSEIIPAGTVLFHTYAHGKMIFYSAAGYITTNTPIMIIGQTGFTDGIHLHVEIWAEIDGIIKYYDPEEFFYNV